MVHFVRELSRGDIVSRLGPKGGMAKRGIVSQYGNSGTLLGYLIGNPADPLFSRFLEMNPLCLVVLLYEVIWLRQTTQCTS